MARSDISKQSVDQLVQRFAELSIDQDMEMLSNAQAKVNKLFWQLDAIRKELKSRPGDQRSALLKLFSHKNMHVRLKAAYATFAIAPVEARAQLEAIAASGWMPQAGQAGMSLSLLDEGISKLGQI